TVHCAARTARVRGEKRAAAPRERNRRYRSRKHEEGHDHDSARGAPTVAQEGGAVMKRGVAARTGREVRQQVLAFLGHDCRVAHGHLRNLMPAAFSMLFSVPIGKSPGCIGTVTRPDLVGWRYCACEPFVRTRSQPSALRATPTSRAVML